MYFSYCIKYRDDEERTTDYIWTTGELSEDRKHITNKQGVTLPLYDSFLKYKHHFHDEPLTDKQLNAL